MITLRLALPLLLLLFACTAAEVRDDRPIDPDAALRPALTRLVPYDFGPQMSQALKWLDNHALTHPRQPDGQRARAWILRARIDWFTAAYAEPARDARIAKLLKLMDNLKVKHDGEVNQTTIKAAIDAIERQAQGVATDPAHARFAEEALLFLTIARHLDQSAPYYTAIAALRRAEPAPGEMSALQNALIVALVDLNADLASLPDLSPDRHPQALARMAAFTCPDALIRYSEAPLETRADPLKNCPSDPAPAALDGLDNTVMLRVLNDLGELTQQGRRALQDRTPLIEHHRADLQTWIDTLEAHRFALAFPESAGTLQSDPAIALAPVSYAAHPGVAPLLILQSADRTRLTTHPTAHLQKGRAEIATAHPKLDLWRYPGVATDDLQTEVDRFLTPLRDALALTPASDLLIPAIAFDSGLDTTELSRTIGVLGKSGFGAVDLLVSDPVLSRAGAMRFALVKTPTAKSAALTIGPGGSFVVFEGEKKTLPGAGTAEAPGSLYLALAAWAERRFDRAIPSLTVEIAPGVTWAQAAAMLGAVRFKRTATPKSAPLDVMNAAIEGDEAPLVLVGRFELIWVSAADR